ncbi:zf-TFIIB domain-containing protein [Roseateles asaccharophilus]|uniref:Zn-finger nucleic acid-binding protein n=1 Tax=Roseateles asaccharophilus TaxID=582607 RepID=A0ABU2ADU6_9BURK|nr:zf-TFIIB domain-containing protein [Roseateles asaccharophilus]MDR7335371.1 Zn-finger nucleic acid-binding protein [Roseateles asaccharophilus]
MPTPASRSCPSCGDRMEIHALPAQYGGEVEIDFCFGCHGLWFDEMENLKLAPQAIATMFKEMHRHHDAPRTPLAARLRCAECRGGLVQGFDLVKSGRYITHRCPSRHGRFSSFSSFMIEKGFVRQLTKPEIADIAKKVGSIHCSACGAPVDLRKEDACSHCRTALSLLDPQAVEKALQTYAHAPARPSWGSPSDVADAVVAMEKERSRAQREDPRLAFTSPNAGVLGVDLLSVGLVLFSSLWDD